MTSIAHARESSARCKTLGQMGTAQVIDWLIAKLVEDTPAPEVSPGFDGVSADAVLKSLSPRGRPLLPEELTPVGFISAEWLAKLRDPEWQFLRNEAAPIWTANNPPSRAQIPLYYLDERTAALVRGAAEERKRADVFAKQLREANLRVRELEQQLAEKLEPLTDDQDRALCESNFNAESDAFFGARPELDHPTLRRIFYAGHRRAWISKDAVIEAAHNIGGKHD